MGRARNRGIRILRSGISVYEVEVDLGKYSQIRTDELRGFARKLLQLLPALEKHECFAGECGGFIAEMDKGTDLAHVMEHVTLEMLRLADDGGRKYSGWTRKTKRRGVYVIHFQAHSGTMARRAARCAANTIERIIEGKPVSRRAVLEELGDGKGEK